MPDTGHMNVTGEDPVEAISGLPIDDIAAVHLKDYDPSYGRSYHRYARGFVCLGDGDVPLDDVLKDLSSRGYDRWLVVEQDHAREPERSLRRSVRWLHDRGLMAELGPPIQMSVTEDGAAPEDELPGLGMSMGAFAQDMFHASELRLREAYEAIAKSCYKLYDACHVSLWSCSPARNEMCWLADYPSYAQMEKDKLQIPKDSAVIGSVVNSMSVSELDIVGSERTFHWTNVAKDVDGSFAVTIPVPNQYNPNAIRLLVGVMTKERKGTVFYNRSAHVVSADICKAVDMALDDRAAIAARKVTHHADKSATLQEFLDSLVELVRTTLVCDAVTVFLPNATGERIEVKASTRGCHWREGTRDQDKCYRPSEINDLTAQCWLEGRTILDVNSDHTIKEATGQKPKSWDALPDNSSGRSNLLIVPIVSAMAAHGRKPRSQIIGVIRCRNKSGLSVQDANVFPYFADDDAAILSAICQAAAPYVDALRGDERFVESFRFLAHELRSPINYLTTAVHRLDKFMNTNRTQEIPKLIDTMTSYCALAHGVVKTAGVIGQEGKSVPLHFEKTLLMGDIIAPLKPLLETQLADRRFDVRSIKYDDFKDIPAIFLDRSLFLQAISNLYTNAIKFAYTDSGKFSIVITTQFTNGEYRINFSDYGPGISEEDEAIIFEHGMRGPGYLARMVGGQGLGLWVSRVIIEAHGGRLKLENAYQPTTFSIYLPESLGRERPNTSTT